MQPDELRALFDDSLATSFASYRIGRALQSAWPDLQLLEGDAKGFDLDAFAAAGLCECSPIGGVHGEIHTRWNAPFLAEDPERSWRLPYMAHATLRPGDGSLARRTENGVYQVRWQDHALMVAVASWAEGQCNHHHAWVLANERAVAEAFFVAVSRFTQAPRNEVLVINGDHWRKDSDLYAAIQSSSLDQLVLPEELRREIVDDFTTFLASRAEYARLAVPWKRGVLLLGPPGNGKTHCLRAVLRLLEVPVIYVQSFRSKYDSDERNIERVFERARAMAPCALVFEDLDAQITDANRSFFLNQMDGFAPNAGLLVLATTNHPERLDPAIVERPSRFDRKYHFGLPSAAARDEFLRQWSERIDAPMRPTAAQRAQLVAATEGFSFAYLKELCLSALLRWLKLRPETGLFPLLEAQLVTLRAQMRSASAKGNGASASAGAGGPRERIAEAVARVLSVFPGSG